MKPVVATACGEGTARARGDPALRRFAGTLVREAAT